MCLCRVSIRRVSILFLCRVSILFRRHITPLSAAQHWPRLTEAHRRLTEDRAALPSTGAKLKQSEATVAAATLTVRHTGSNPNPNPSPNPDPRQVRSEAREA